MAIFRELRLLVSTMMASGVALGVPLKGIYGGSFKGIYRALGVLGFRVQGYWDLGLKLYLDTKEPTLFRAPYYDLLICVLKTVGFVGSR